MSDICTAGWSASKKASRYSHWMESGKLRGINDNEFVKNGDQLKLPATLAMAKHDSKCFDEAYYAFKNAVSATRNEET